MDLTQTFCNGPVSAGHEEYSSLTQCSTLRGIPKKILLLAKKERPQPLGFKQNKHINWAELGPWLQDHYERLEEKVNESVSTDLKEQKLEQEIIALKNKNKRDDKRFIERKPVIKTVTTIKDKWGDQLRQKLEYELPPKCANLDELEITPIMRKFCDELLSKFSTPLSQWEECKDMPETDEDDHTDGD